ncbi:MAG: heme exporter protein CcmD [Betaproteobacteria bacterium RIFCSPLOWO2_12_FULL_67_28]|nr:MAG: heme exporter protein CcmD [Betaproteobacteria bacterium RIFCSPLOWO2_02_FULL_68_150]OGA61524.1 MAG: heme exporter protein CcmD [Betaproteobacteria bacterium RIFCSPLOWO2_12_FULL_67_28]
MNWNSAAEFFAMGGYGFYVWGSFIAAAAGMTAEPVLLAVRHRRALERVQAERMRHETPA